MFVFPRALPPLVFPSFSLSLGQINQRVSQMHLRGFCQDAYRRPPLLRWGDWGSPRDSDAPCLSGWLNGEGVVGSAWRCAVWGLSARVWTRRMHFARFKGNRFYRLLSEGGERNSTVTQG